MKQTKTERSIRCCLTKEMNIPKRRFFKTKHKATKRQKIWHGENYCIELEENQRTEGVAPTFLVYLTELIPGRCNWCQCLSLKNLFKSVNKMTHFITATKLYRERHQTRGMLGGINQLHNPFPSLGFWSIFSWNSLRWLDIPDLFLICPTRASGSSMWKMKQRAAPTTGQHI